MNFAAIEKELRRHIQNELYLQNKGNDYEVKAQNAARAYIQKHYPGIIKVNVKTNYFGDLTIELG